MLLRFSITRKFVLAFLALSIVPLCALGITTLQNLRAIGQRAIDSTTNELEALAKDSLELRAVELANRVTLFLHSCEADLFTLAILPRSAEVYQQFSQTRQRTVWTREGTNDLPVEMHKDVHLYKEVAFIGADGVEMIRVVDNTVQPRSELRDVSDPKQTAFKSERYFSEARKLGVGEVYVSHVTGWHVTRAEQLGRADHLENAVEGRRFEGVLRFATPCFGASGEFEGVVMLSLDHRHLMELTLHVLPTDERFTVFPSYASGNYAFMFDEEGWIITHPKFFNIRGLRTDGTEFDPHAPTYTRERVLAGEVPYNLDRVSFIDPNYPLVAKEVRSGRAGVVSAVNVGGTRRIMAFAPIFYDRPAYRRYGIFGGITIGVDTNKFQEPAKTASARIDEMVTQTKHDSLLILGAAALIAVVLGIVLSRRFTRPILSLAAQARKIAGGKIPDDVVARTGDELELLAENFGEMAREIRRHQEDLESSLEDLAESNRAVEHHSRDLETKVRVLKNVHYLSQYLSTVYDREQVLETVLKTCVDGLGYDRALLYLYDARSRSLVCHRTFGFQQVHEARAKEHPYDIDLHDCIPTRVFRSGETVFVRDIRADERATPIDRRISEVGETDCFVFTPIKTRARVIGVLGADTKITQREISEIEVESLEILANDAARAIERSELYGKLVAERNFIKSILNHLPSGIITLDEKGTITWINPYSEKVFGVTLEQGLGKQYGDVFSGVPSWIAVVERLVTSAESVPKALEYVMQDGKERVLEVHFSPIYREKEHQRNFLIFVRDVTQRKQLEGHLRRSDRLVSLGVLAAGIAHEMRNPLTGLSLVMDDLHDHLRDRHRERELIQLSLQEIDRLENLINSLLDFAVPSRSMTLELRPIGTLFADTLFLVRKMCRNQQISLTVRTDDPLPPINFDPEKLKQALLNLLLNAIQAMPNGGSLLLEVTNVFSDESLLGQPAVCISVADSGTGIPSEDIPYIFDPFFTRHPSGCGLGLAIVHSIVEEHKGRIAVSSQVGEGTTFRVDLPAAGLSGQIV